MFKIFQLNLIIQEDLKETEISLETTHSVHTFKTCSIFYSFPSIRDQRD